MAEDEDIVEEKHLLARRSSRLSTHSDCFFICPSNLHSNIFVFPFFTLKMHPSIDIHDVIIVGAGPCGLAVAARIQEETPSAMFTDEEHQRYHWIKKHTGRMKLVQAGHGKNKAVRAERWNGGQKINEAEKGRRESTGSASSIPSLSSSSSVSRNEPLSTLVLDGSGAQWMQRWNNAFRVLEIQQLRSPMFFHVDPGDRDGMLAYTQEMGRDGDLWEISGCVGKEMSKHKKKKRRQGGKSQYVVLRSFNTCRTPADESLLAERLEESR